MAVQTHPEGAQSLALAMLAASGPPLLLIDGDLNLVAASTSFGREFRVDVSNAIGRPTFDLGDGRWDLPQLRVLLNATLVGPSDADSFEMSLESDFREPRRLVLSAHKRVVHGRDERHPPIGTNGVHPPERTGAV